MIWVISISNVMLLVKFRIAWWGHNSFYFSFLLHILAYFLHQLFIIGFHDFIPDSIRLSASCNLPTLHCLQKHIRYIFTVSKSYIESHLTQLTFICRNGSYPALEQYLDLFHSYNVLSPPNTNKQDGSEWLVLPAVLRHVRTHRTCWGVPDRHD